MITNVNLMYQPSRTVQYKCEMGHHRITYHVDQSTVLGIRLKENTYLLGRELYQH